MIFAKSRKGGVARSAQTFLATLRSGIPSRSGGRCAYERKRYGRGRVIAARGSYPAGLAEANCLSSGGQAQLQLPGKPMRDAVGDRLATESGSRSQGQYETKSKMKLLLPHSGWMVVGEGGVARSVGLHPARASAQDEKLPHLGESRVGAPDWS